MANYNKMTPTKFSAIKLLLDGGASTQEAAKYMKVSTATIYAVGKNDTFADYVNWQTSRVLAAKKAREEKRAAAEKVAEKVGAVPAATLAKPQEKPQEKPVPQVVEYRQNVTIQATHYMMEELRKTNELLTLISNKLAFIVDELCGVPTKKEG